MLRWLFVDFNAYFASVEQHLQPSLRARPIAVAPVSHDSGCCIAASYEAKKFGVKTGDRVREAKWKCPSLVIVPPRHDEYVRMHHRLVSAVETVLPIEGVHSIDEMSCHLGTGQKEPEAATAIARRVKEAIRDQVGAQMRCSIGIAPNRFLAKVGTDMQKPDGLIVIQKHELPHRLFSLALRDLPGIGPKMEARLQSRGVRTIEQLCERSEAEMDGLWESVVGRRWHLWLRGEDFEQAPGRRRSIGHQHVIPPKHRSPDEARAVMLRLLTKAAARARLMGYWARHMCIRVRFKTDSPRAGSPEPSKRSVWAVDVALQHGCQDTLRLIEIAAQLWNARPADPGPIQLVDVTLHDLIPDAAATPPLFAPERSRIALCKAIDTLNARYGKNTVYSGAVHAHRDAAQGGIAFTSVPDPANPDSPGVQHGEEAGFPIGWAERRMARQRPESAEA